jgi:adenosylcobinamide-GDP ribazoletransferase
MEERYKARSPELKNGTVIAFFTAIRFLTIVPLRWQCDKDGELFQRSVFYFPVVGMLIGCAGGALTLAVNHIVPHSVSAFLLILFLSAISGFLHLDGLADSADGLLSARPTEESLRIMKDSRTGAMGVVALVVVLLGKYAALSAMLPEILVVAALSMPLAGRSAILITMALQPYARAEGGIGGMFYSSKARYAALSAAVFLVACTLIFSNIRVTAVVCIMTAITVIAFSFFCRTRIGGVTGDTLGAACELTEMSVAIGLTSLI